MQRSTTVNIDEVLEAILRGAAKTLGCNSANLVVFNERRSEVRIQIGLLLQRQQQLEEVERMFGGTINDWVFSIEQARDTALHRCWHERKVLEVERLVDLARGAIPEEILAAADQVIGAHRFLCVPVLGEARCYGTLIFEKRGTRPYSPQQRELLIRYARRIGEIIENHARSASLGALPAPRGTRLARLLVDEEGQLVGGDGDRDGDVLGTDLRQELQAATRDLLGEDTAEERRLLRFTPPERVTPGPVAEATLEVELERLPVAGRPHALCTVRRRDVVADRSIQDHLLQIALEKSAPTLLLDPDFRITTCNDATRAVLGYATDDLMGQDVAALFGDEDIHTILDHQFLFLSQGHYEEVTVVRHRDGTPRPVKIEALLLADEQTHIVGYLLLIRPQAGAEADAAAPPPDLRQLMRRERLATMGEIAAQLAHEIRNPLLAIGATLESVRDEDDPEELHTVLSSLSQEIDRLDLVLKEYLSLAARRNASVTRVDLRDVVEAARELLQGQLHLAGKRIVSEVPTGLELVADFDGLKQVFFNLLANALEASPAGGTVACGAEETAAGYRIHVDDEGVGLQSPARECLVPFFSTKPSGTGLGLTVSQRIVEAHHGQLGLANRDAGGCRATVELPRRGSA